MKKIFKKLIKVNHSDNKDNFLNFSIYYKKGEGYLLSVVPIQRKETGNYAIEEFGAYTGFKTWLIKCNRASKKKRRRKFTSYER